MRRLHVGILAMIWLAIGAPAAAQRYTAARDGEVVRLTDTAAGIVVSIAPAVGNIAFDLAVNGQRVLYWPYQTVAEFAARPAMSGIPFMGPWANRLDEQAFYANGRRYAFDMTVGNVRGAIPIHGFLTTTDQWRAYDVQATATAAWVTSRLDVFRQPLWMKQWPFAHAIEMTYRLENGTLEVATAITNLITVAMPVAIGFHPYFQLTDSPRDEWTIAVGARTHWLLAASKVPTGETEPIERLFPDPAAAPLRDHDLDDVFSDLNRDARGRATMTVSGKRQRLDVSLGPNYRSVVVWAPTPQNFICFEPMAGITNAINMAHKGTYKELQTIAPGGTWRESFWIRPGGF